MSKVTIDRELLERIRELMHIIGHRQDDYGVEAEYLGSLLKKAIAHPAKQGEVVEVVAWVNPSDLNLMSRYGYHSCTAKAVKVPCFTEPLMTVAQHQRILAASVPAGCKVVPVELLERAALLLQDSMTPPAGCSDFDDWAEQGNAVAAELRALLNGGEA